MLREILHVQQRPGEPRRRWFHSSDHDLYVWTDEAQAITAFELCYSKGRKERAVVWRAGQGVAHFRVDDGESAALLKSSPVLARDADADLGPARSSFLAACAGLPAEVADFVAARLG